MREHTGLQTPRTHSLLDHVVGASAQRMAAVWSHLMIPQIVETRQRLSSTLRTHLH